MIYVGEVQEREEAYCSSARKHHWYIQRIGVYRMLATTRQKIALAAHVIHFSSFYILRSSQRRIQCLSSILNQDLCRSNLHLHFSHHPGSLPH